MTGNGKCSKVCSILFFIVIVVTAANSWFIYEIKQEIDMQNKQAAPAAADINEIGDAIREDMQNKSGGPEGQ